MCFILRNNKSIFCFFGNVCLTLFSPKSLVSRQIVVSGMSGISGIPSTFLKLHLQIPAWLRLVIGITVRRVATNVFFYIQIYVFAKL